MEELIRQISDVARGMWKYRWSGVLAAWVVAAIGAIVVMRIPDRYEASARIFVDTQSILKPLMSGLAVQPNIDQQVTMLSRTLISRPNVEKLVRMADLDLKASSKADQESLIENLTKTLVIKSTDRDNLYTLSFRDSDASKAKRVVQSLLSIFVESSLGASRKDTDAAKTFLNEQIRAYQAKLEDAEARLKEFKLRNIELQTADGRDSAARMGELADQLRAARLELKEAENARDAAKSQMQREFEKASDPGSASTLPIEPQFPIATPDIDARLDTNRRNLDALLLRYTDQHPDVVAARRIIKELEEQKDKEIKRLKAEAAAAAASAAAAAAAGGGAGSGNPLAEEMRRMMGTYDVQIASLKARVAEYAQRYDAAKQSLKTAPQIEAEYAQLNRDYGIHKRNYEDLVSRRESATMSGNLEVASGTVDFRLIDPPRVSPKPVFPNRLLLLPLALLAGLAAGLLTSFVVAELRPVFHGAAQLRTKVQLPLLGVVSLALSETQAKRERADAFRFWAASGVLVGVFAVGLTVMSFLADR